MDGREFERCIFAPPMKKHDADGRPFVAAFGRRSCARAGIPCYQGYFRCCFNEGRYYEAHDVLEHLWLGGGRADANTPFTRG